MKRTLEIAAPLFIGTAAKAEVFSYNDESTSTLASEKSKWTNDSAMDARKRETKTRIVKLRIRCDHIMEVWVMSR